jgi:hypothetical protein
MKIIANQETRADNFGHQGASARYQVGRVLAARRHHLPSYAALRALFQGTSASTRVSGQGLLRMRLGSEALSGSGVQLQLCLGR